MKQVTKFYLTSFLKNQTYFTPILIIFLQFNHLSLQEIFWVFTLGSVLSFVCEIPTGTFADFHGKKRSIVISKFLIFLSYVLFGFSGTFLMFVLSQALFELGNSFRTGTETAYTFEYLRQNSDNPTYTEVKGKQKFWARIGEAIAAGAGGFIAVTYGYNTVFFAASVPAFANFLLALSWSEIDERKETGVSLRRSLAHVIGSLKDIISGQGVLNITLNITLFTSVLAALNKFIQPYMVSSGVPVDWFGYIYSASLILTAVAVRYAYLVEERIGRRKTINLLSGLALIPVGIIGSGYVGHGGVLLFFLVVLIENIRSPIENHEFHSNVPSEKRATLGSLLELSKSMGKIIILPIAGYLADAYSLSGAVLAMGGVLLFNALFLYVRTSQKP